jgi:hypothetical protein
LPYLLAADLDGRDSVVSFWSRRSKSGAVGLGSAIARLPSSRCANYIDVHDGLNPYDDALQDARRLWTRARFRAIDFAKTHLTVALGKTLLASAAAVAVGIYDLPAFASIFCSLVILALLVHAIYSTRRLKRQDSELRYAWIANKRILQRNLDHQIASDNVILELMGERPSHQRAFRSAPPEMRSALAYLKRRLANAEARAEAAEAVKEGRATDAQRRAVVRRRRGRERPVPKGPAVEPIRRRREAREAERTELEAEIQALASADDIGQAMHAEEVKGARRTRREREDAARKADQAVRDRVRAGRRPTVEAPEHLIAVGIKPNGDQDMGSARGAPTPEQIARGEVRSPGPSGVPA